MMKSRMITNRWLDEVSRKKHVLQDRLDKFNTDLAMKYMIDQQSIVSRAAKSKNMAP